MTNEDDHKELVQNVLKNSTRIFFLEDDSQMQVKNSTSLISHGGIEGIFKVVDISSLPENSSGRDIQTKLTQMGENMPVLCIAKFTCQNRDTGDFKLDILTTNGDVVVTLERKKRLGILWLSDGDKEIPFRFSDGSVASVVRVEKSGNAVEIDVVGEDIMFFKRWTPSWQASTKWLCFAFLCFLPTAGLGGCFGFYKASKSDVVTNLTKNHRGTVKDLGTSIRNVIRLDGASLWKEKLTLLCLGAYMMTDRLTDPPVSHTHSHAM